MQISYFEEFPEEKSLSKLKLLKSKPKLYLAAKSVAEFKQIKTKYKLRDTVYWPILDKKDGYWISPFSRKKALIKIFSEVKEESIPIMLDLELPTRWNPLLYFTQLFNFHHNKKLIKQFINNYSGQVYLAEYYPEGKKKEKLMEWLGIHFSNPNVKVIKMLYHSLHNFNREFMVKELQRGRAEFGDNYLIGLGTIAKGVDGNEPILSIEQLQRDLQLAQECGIKEVVIFRLSGLNKEYVKAIEK